MGSPVLAGFNARGTMMRVSLGVRAAVAAGVQTARHTAVLPVLEEGAPLDTDVFPDLVHLHLGRHSSLSL